MFMAPIAPVVSAMCTVKNYPQFHLLAGVLEQHSDFCMPFQWVPLNAYNVLQVVTYSI